MRFHRVVPLMLALASPSAWAGELSLGLGLGVLHDLTANAPTAEAGQRVASCQDVDADGKPIYDCGPSSVLSLLGGRIAVPLRYTFTDRAALRFGPRVEFGGRTGRVEFPCTSFQDPDREQLVRTDECTVAEVDEEKSIIADRHWGASAVGVIAVGPEFSIPVRDSSLYFGAELSIGVAYSLESMGPNYTDPDDANARSPTDGLLDDFRKLNPNLDPGATSCDSGLCQDAFAFVPVVGVDLLVGLRAPEKHRCSQRSDMAPPA